MNDTAEQLLSEFKLKGWDTRDLYPRMFKLAEDPAGIFGFLQGFLAAFGKGATLFNDALSYVGRADFGILVGQAIGILEKGANENAESVIEYASLQFPDLLHDRLEALFRLRPNANSYYEEYPWRNLARSRIPAFRDRLLDPAVPPAEKQRLFTCLLETRDEETLAFACDYALSNKLHGSRDAGEFLASRLEAIGYTWQDGGIRSYCPNRPRHFVFPKGYFAGGQPVFLSRTQHPTWRLPAGGPSFRFGGALDEDAENPLFHIATFDEIPDGLNVTGLERLTLGCHVRELNEYGPVFYRHDAEGKPARLPTRESGPIQFFSDHPIKEACIGLADTPPRWQFQSWGAANGRESLFRLGGEPAWIQSAEVPCCPLCFEKMDFLMQLDSDLPTGKGGELMFGSGGICYVFWCDRTKVSGYVMQCT